MSLQMEDSTSLPEKLARLAQLETDFQRALEMEKLEAMAEFAAGAGHEINNPLAVISGRAQLLLRDETDVERRRILAIISAQAMRVYEMIADMMLFARPPKPQPEDVDLVKLVDAVVLAFVPNCKDQQTVLCRVGEQRSLVARVDPSHITVAVRAIIQNAMELLQSGGKIEVELAEAECWAKIRISDDGPGIHPEERRHIFDPYYSARQAGRGLGLGLSKAWKIVANHQGRIDVESEPGRGASFTIWLPMPPTQ